MGIDYESPEFAISARAMGLAIEDAIALVERVIAEVELEVITGADTPGATPALLAIVAAARADGHEIHRIQQGEHTRWEPDRPLPEGMWISEWQTKRLCGELRPRDPQPVKKTYTSWYAGVTSNPVLLEQWLWQRGYHGGATGPTWCRICNVGDEGQPDHELITMMEHADSE